MTHNFAKGPFPARYNTRNGGETEIVGVGPDGHLVGQIRHGVGGVGKQPVGPQLGHGWVQRPSMASTLCRPRPRLGSCGYIRLKATHGTLSLVKTTVLTVREKKQSFRASVSYET